MSPPPLTEKDIKVGTIIWYSGNTSTFSWDCPAEITYTNHATRIFKIKSLDDMLEQRQEYTFDTNEYSPASRTSMYLPDMGDVRRYINTICQAKGRFISDLQEDLRKKEAELTRISDYLLRSDMQVERID